MKEVWTSEFLPNIRDEIRKVTGPMEASITKLNTKIHNIRQEIHQELEPLKAIISDLSKKFEAIETSQKFISSQYDAVLSTVQDVKKQNQGTENRVQRIEEGMSDLSKDSYDLEAKLDELEQSA